MMEETFMTPEQVATRLQVTRLTVYEWLRSGRLPGVRLGNRIRELREQVGDNRTAHEAAIVSQLDELNRQKSVAADPQGLAATAAYLQSLLYVEYLMRARGKDGTWFVRTRAIPSNPYFESGFPHGRSQFISYAATCHAVIALALTVERK